MDTPVTETINKGLHDICQRDYPALYSAIKSLADQGEKQAIIQRFIDIKCPIRQHPTSNGLASATLNHLFKLKESA